MNLRESLIKRNIGAIVDLYDLLGENINAPNFYITHDLILNDQNQYQPITFQGRTYENIPIQSTGFKASVEGTRDQPTLELSNINKYLMQAVLEHEGLVGATVNRWHVLEDELDTGIELTKQTYIINQLAELSRTHITFSLKSKIDNDKAKLPFRQVLRDPHLHNQTIYQFPGVSRKGTR